MPLKANEVKAGQVLARVDNGPYIRSPIDGTVIDVKMEEGDYANPSDVVMVVAKTSDIYITANVEETNILKIHTGAARVRFTGCVWPGVLTVMSMMSIL